MKKRAVIIIAIELILMMVSAFLLYKRPYFELSVPIWQATPDLGEVRDNALFFDFDAAEQVESTDQMIPWHLKLSIPKGYYNVAISYRSDAASKISLYSPSDPGAVKCDEIALDHIYNPRSVKMRVTRDVDDLDIYMKYCGFQTFMIDGIFIQNSNRDIPAVLCIIFFFMICLDVVLYLYFKGITPKTSETYRAVLILTGFALLVSIPLFFDHLTLYDDFAFSYIKIEGI
ncbi:MAG: hypothetical protein K6G22_04150, partial [Lachnospiraceae bacterium]|nr:hypothetical protein [Lachnospiraceae bacterium]